MSRYRNINATEGTRCLQLVWNFSFMPISESELFITPFGDRERADCAEFQVDQASGLLVRVPFFVNSEELTNFLINTKGQIYLFGAYNQINVCQMRSLGTVTSEENHPDTDAIRERLRAKIKARIGARINKLWGNEAQTRFDILDRGKLFCFCPEDYAFATYERG
jgi:hypothetical protein